MEYDNNEFENENSIVKLNLKSEDVCLDDYKEIHESNKFQTQLNYFEDSEIDYNHVNKSKQHVINQVNNNKTYQRPQSPKLKGNQSNNESSNKRKMNNNNGKMALIDLNLNTSSNMFSDSYGDNIIKNLHKYRQMALEESSIQK